MTTTQNTRYQIQVLVLGKWLITSQLSAVEATAYAEKYAQDPTVRIVRI